MVIRQISEKTGSDGKRDYTVSLGAVHNGRVGLVLERAAVPTQGTRCCGQGLFSAGRADM